MKKLPKILYVRRENEGTTDEFLNTCERIEEVAEVGKVHTVGEYTLTNMLKITAPVVIKK